MSSPKGSKRGKDDASNASSSDNKRPRTTGDGLTLASAETEISYEWLDEGTLAADGRMYHDVMQVTLKDRQFTVRKGDAVLLYGHPDDEQEWPCRVEQMWQPADEQDVQFTARWFYHRTEITRLPGDWHGPISREKLLETMLSREVVLSNQTDQNEIASIQGPCSIVYHRPDAREVFKVPEDAFLCRYRLDVHPQRRQLNLASFDEEPEDRGTMTNETLESLSSDEESVQSTRAPIVEGEGSTLRADIAVGSVYQASVGPFVPGIKVKSRNPKLIWSPGKISEEELQGFMDKLADLHTTYLQQKGLTNEEPYSPLSADATEKLMRQNVGNKHLTGSTLSTASMLGSKRAQLLKECNVDAVLELLQDHNYDTNKALAAAKDNLDSLSSGWTQAEKDIFDDNFRRSQGNLRSIGKSIAPTKTMQDVVDYYFRFKIPDQFRRYQDKKREKAVRIMECIEKRRYHEYALLENGDKNAAAKRKKPSNWSETAMSDATGALDERRKAAKALLLDVREIMGQEKMAEVAAVIRQLHQSYEAETKDALFALLRGEPELQQRFLEFLPKHF